MNRRGALFSMHVAALMFGLTGIFGKLAQTGPANITFNRALFAVLTLAAVSLLLRRSDGRTALPALRQWPPLVLGGLLLCLHWITFFMAVKLGGVAIATLGFCSFPASTLLLEGLFFKERIRQPEYLTLALVCLGLLLVTPRFALGDDATLGLLAAVLSGLLFALLSLLNRATTQRIDPVHTALVQNLTVVACLLPLSLPTLPGIAPLDWLWLAMLGMFCTGLAHTLFVASLRVLNARTASVIFALEPVYGIAFAWWLFAERPTPRALAGGLVIILASLVASRMRAAPQNAGA